MELKIFNSILFGELQPFTGENKNEEYFANKLNPKISVSANMDNFEEQLNMVLKDHPLFSEPGEYLFNLNPEENKIEITSQKAEIFEPLIDIDIPPTFNCTTEFYLYLITNEAKKVKTKLISEISTASNQIDALNNIRIIITQIEFLLKNLAIAFKELPEKGIPYYEPKEDESDTERIQMNTHFVFYVLKLTLIRLYYDMEILFSSTYDIKFKNKIQFYSEVVGEKHPAILAQDASKRMAISSARVLTEAKDFKKAQAFETWRELIEYFQKDQSNHEIEQALAAIENKIFLESNNVEQRNCTFEELKSQILCDAELASAEAKYNEIVGTKDLGYERLEVIEELLDLIFKNFIGHNFDTINIQNSIPRNLYKWLVSKASLYRNSLTFSFASQEVKEINNVSNEISEEKTKPSNITKTQDKRDITVKSKTQFLENLDLLTPSELKDVLDMLENLKITDKTKYILGDRKKSSVRAVLEVMIERNKIPNHSIKKLCLEVSDKIEAGIKSLPEKGKNIYDFYENATKKAIK